ncbi:hypothetical protein [Nocardioides sp. GY 10127]|uniref:hypothetical protein n=1 Tax=Nocardioides sp. GY 10127 TaxID=2569762 RepID=UPI0010A785F3|nr:hypothetical protein [Nocardioides sp. GY 10127]TIC81833.1 hypothetical protein E8D37_11710 [Nocardioides sp. GY 10127]
MTTDQLRRLPLDPERRSSLGMLADAQEGLLARRQLLEHGVSGAHVAQHLRADRWSSPTPRVVLLGTGRLDRVQREWLGTLHAGPRSLLGGLTALSCHGLIGWERDEVTVWVDGRLAFEPVPGISFFRTRRPFASLRATTSRPLARVEPATLLHAGYHGTPRAADGLVAAVVQQRLTTPDRLAAWVESLQPLRRARLFRAAVDEVATGAHSRLERDVVRLCREAGLAPPRQQTRRQDADGRQRWTDCEWRLPDGRVLVLEVDGSAHREAAQWAADKRRARRLTSAETLVISCTAHEVRHEPHEIVADLVRLGVPRRGRVPGRASEG